MTGVVQAPQLIVLTVTLEAELQVVTLLVTVTLYVPAPTVTEALVDEGRFHEYTSPPVAVKVVVLGLPEEHTVNVPPIKAVGLGLTTTFTEAVDVQFDALVTVTV